MTYWRYWQLTGAPFANDLTHPLFRGASVEEAIARIEFLITNRRHVGSLMGASGVGKSSVLRHCASNPPITPEVPSVLPIRLSMLGMSKGEFTSTIAMRLTGCRSDGSSTAAWKSLCDYFQASSREGTQTVLFLDDAESSTRHAEDELCRLLSMTFPLTVVFAVESQLASSVSKSLFDRTELQIDLPSWELSQTAEFLAWTFQRLGRNEPVFTDNAVERIQQLSEGLARRIVQLADLSLVAGAVSQSDYIDADCIDQVSWELPKNHAA